jgi:hypothetical protein
LRPPSLGDRYFAGFKQDGDVWNAIVIEIVENDGFQFPNLPSWVEIAKDTTQRRVFDIQNECLLKLKMFSSVSGYARPLTSASARPPILSSPAGLVTSTEKK